MPPRAGSGTPATAAGASPPRSFDSDDGVLIGNRFDRSLPIVDEVRDVALLPLGALAAVEVAEAGASVA